MENLVKQFIRPQSLGGDTTALGVHTESAWTHITCNPVAMNLSRSAGLAGGAAAGEDFGGGKGGNRILTRRF